MHHILKQEVSRRISSENKGRKSSSEVYTIRATGIRKVGMKKVTEVVTWKLPAAKQEHSDVFL